MKPRIFIGSSKEGIKYLNYIKAKIQDEVDCFAWTNASVFRPNKGILDTLIKQAKLSDFALLIATKDDVVTSSTRDGERNTARDNVIFEHGLFLGATSVERAFLVAEEGIDLPSDFNGVQTLIFSEKADSYNHIDIICDQLLENIKRAASQSELGFVPSTALAIGYFSSFVKRVCEEIGRNNAVNHKGKDTKVKSFKMYIILPENIDDNGVNDFIAKYNRSNELDQASTTLTPGAAGRGYPFHFKIDPPVQDDNSPIDVHLFDIPTTLNTIQEAIKLYFPSTFVGTDTDREHLEKRELKNFANVLRYYIQRNAWTRSSVEVIENTSI